MLQLLLYELQQDLAEISGLPGVCLQPAAGAQGELTALMVAAAYFQDRGEKRTKVLSPDSAHGTNPASAKMAGFDTLTIRSTDDGFVDMDDLGRQARRSSRRFHDYQSKYVGTVRPAGPRRSPTRSTLGAG